MQKLLLGLLFFCVNLSFSQLDLGGNIHQLNEFNDALTIQEVIQKEEKGLFNIPFKIEVYKTLTGKEANWICIHLNKQTNHEFISIENALFEELNFYKLYNSELTSLDNVQDKHNYRFPLVKIDQKETPCKLFIRTRDYYSFRTKFTIKSFTYPKLITHTQREYFVIGSYTMMLLALLISISIFFLYKRQYIILWYATHVCGLILEYLISTGIFSLWFLDSHYVRMYNIHHLSVLISMLAIAEFFRNYYSYTKATLISKYLYLIITIICGVGILYAIFDTLNGNIYNVQFYSQTALTYASLICLIAVFILTIQKAIPLYLFIAFLMPVAGIFANLNGFRSLFTNPNIIYFIFKSVYLGILIEVSVITFYIIKQSIDVELIAISLKKENSTLKNNFDAKLATNQEQHQNALLSDVHDSFGGYIEALKINLLNQDNNQQQMLSILDAFRKDYRVLLNSLYIPNVDTWNFEEAIKEYCDKMTDLTKINITFHSEKERFVILPQNVVKLIFKSSSELITNAIKHANADNITVSLIIRRTDIKMSVQDNGIGFDEAKIKNTSFGIRTIKERVENLQGNFDLSSNPKKGTNALLNIPIS